MGARNESEDDVVFDRNYVRMLLTEVRPDATLEEFAAYAGLPEPALAAGLWELQEAGEVAVYGDPFNPPIVCLTPLGMSRAGVRLSEGHPPEWVSVATRVPPAVAAAEAGMVRFSELEAELEAAGGAATPFADRRVDPRAAAPVEVVAAVEEFASTLVDRFGRALTLPRGREFCLLGIGRPWPLDAPPRATPRTPSASTWQERYTRCPYCRARDPDAPPCPRCGGRAPATPCPECAGRPLGAAHYCCWCSRSGLDGLLPAAADPEVRRRPEPKSKSKSPRRKLKVKGARS
jgi:hypothetical protein